MAISIDMGLVAGRSLWPATVEDTTATLPTNAEAYVGDYCVNMGEGSVYQITAINGTTATVGSSLGVLVEVADALKEGSGIKIVDGEITLDAHAAEDKTYGGGSADKYGHVKTTNTYDATSSDESTVLNQAGAYSMFTALKSQIETGVEDADFIPTSEKGAPGGVAELDDDGLILSSQLPSSIDEIHMYDTRPDFPSEGEDNKIYVAKDTGITYRWGGEDYVEISESLALGFTELTAFRGDWGLIAYDHTQETGNPHKTTLADIIGSVAIGSDTKPTFYNGSALQECGDTLDVNISGNAETANAADTAKTAETATSATTAETAKTAETATSATTAETATKIGNTTIGSSDTPVFISSGTPTECTNVATKTDVEDALENMDHTSAIVDFLTNDVTSTINSEGHLIWTITVD